MPFSKESTKDQIDDWIDKIAMFRDKCPMIIKPGAYPDPEQDPVVMEKKAGLEAAKKALLDSNRDGKKNQRCFGCFQWHERQHHQIFTEGNHFRTTCGTRRNG